MLTPALPITLGRYRIDWHSEPDARHPRFAGSAWRGALGHELRRIACLTGARECTGCSLLHQCAYSYLFATPVPADAAMMSRYSEAPHPYVLHETQQDGSHVSLDLTLIGQANAHLTLMLHALQRAAASEQGIAGRRLRMQSLRQWHEADQGWQELVMQHGTVNPLPAQTPRSPPLPPGNIRIDLLTPLRLRRQGQHVTPDQFGFADLFTHLLRRLSLLSYFHNSTPLDVDFRSLSQQARTITLHDARLQWIDLLRHSNRQHADMALGGLLGHIVLESTPLEAFWPYLWLGQYTHVGRATTMGLGAYRIQGSASLPDCPPLLS